MKLPPQGLSANHKPGIHSGVNGATDRNSRPRRFFRGRLLQINQGESKLLSPANTARHLNLSGAARRTAGMNSAASARMTKLRMLGVAFVLGCGTPLGPVHRNLRLLVVAALRLIAFQIL
jgi:hypothetical protein